MMPLRLAGGQEMAIAEVRRERALLAFVPTEPAAGCDPSGMETTAVGDGAG